MATCGITHGFMADLQFPNDITGQVVRHEFMEFSKDKRMKLHYGSPFQTIVFVAPEHLDELRAWCNKYGVQITES